MLNATQMQALKTELLTDPNSYGYAPLVADTNNPALAEMVNLIRSAISINRGIVPSYELYEAIVPTEWASLTAQEKQRIQTILSMGQVDTTGANTRASFSASFAAGTASRSNLVALLTRKGSRAEQLFGIGVSVSVQEVIDAQRL